MKTLCPLPKFRRNRWSFFLVIALAALPSGAAVKGTGGYDAPYFQADFYQDLTEYSAALVNPALTYRVNQLHLDAGVYLWAIDDGAKSWGFWQAPGFLYPIRRSHTAGITLISAIAPPIPQSEIDPNTWSVNETGTTSFTDMWFVGTYGVVLHPPYAGWINPLAALLSWGIMGTPDYPIALGVNIKERLQSQFDQGWTMGTPSVDLGLYFNAFDHYRFGDLGMSINFQDFVPAQTKWVADSISEVNSPVTTRFRAGLRYSLLNDKIVLAGEYVLDNAFSGLWKGMMEFATVDTTTGRVTGVSTEDGIEALKKVGRFGGAIKWQFIPQVWIKGGWTNNNIPYLGLNVNLMYPLPEVINYMSADMHLGYSFIELAQGMPKDERDITFMGKISADVGPTREQKESKRLYDKLILAPMNAYIEAMKLYEAKKYWLASFAFGKVLTLFPNFHLNDKVTFYMGNCYRYLYMNDVSREVFQEGLEKFPTSEMRAKFLYGLMSIDYREEKFDDGLKNHAFIVNLYPESDIRPDADYLAGEIHFQRKNFHAAEQLLSGIKRQDAAYLYAQYTLAIVNVENKRDDAAIQNLKTIVEDTTQDPAKLLLLDAANLKLGHLYYEKVELRKAVESYKRVSAGSRFGDEALIGMAWSWVKAGQTATSLTVLDQLTATYPQSAFIPEAYLLKGYGNMLLSRYPVAKSMLEQCVQLCKGDFITDEDLQQRKQKFEGEVVQFKPTGGEIKKNAMRRPTDRTLMERDGLKTQYDAFAKENEDFFTYTLLAKAHSKFLRRKEQMLLDAEYALAKVVSKMGTMKGEQQLEKDKGKIENIDQEIEKLKKEMGQ